MTDEVSSGNIETKLAYDGSSVDWFLQRLSNLTNSSDLEFGITLQVSGTTVTGTLIGGEKYFKLFAESFSQAWPYEDKEEIRDAFESNADIYKNVDKDEDLPPTQYVHLKDALFFDGGYKFPNEGTLWLFLLFQAGKQQKST